MSKFLPESREEAFAYQFEDDIKILQRFAKSSKESFQKHLAVLQAHIDAYNNETLQKACIEAEEDSLIKENFLKEKMSRYPYELLLRKKMKNR